MKKRLSLSALFVSDAQVLTGVVFTHATSVCPLTAHQDRKLCPKQHREGHYKLGSWVSVQRRKKNVMPPKRQ
jgi:hypothetical protein